MNYEKLFDERSRDFASRFRSRIFARQYGFENCTIGCRLEDHGVELRTNDYFFRGSSR
jgi:hypothetical protein